ncbi:NHL repeat-containing protein [Maricaulis maris]|uniref:Tetratricopeptide repeat protein n=1 Tax=Maricaulis maris TaxID=74318 RepID=A0A495D4Q6_9PROT|nr:hypothetical protein [Maricaulis maris]RKQ96000.1 hypothetical protein C7435_2249 [Maricaulis maris]
MTFKASALAASLACLLTLPTFAQDESPAAPTPQSIALEMFSEAGRALRAGDTESARRLMQAALDLKPAHPAVLRALVTIATRAGRADDGFEALDNIVAAGLTFEPAAETITLLEAADNDRLTAVRAALTANAAPTGSGEIIARIDRPDALIEGVAVDIETDRIFASSVAQREILMLEPFARDEPIVFADREDGLWSVFGLFVDDRTRMLWAASGTVDQTPLDEGEEGGTALFAFDLMTGELYRRYTIDGAVQMADFVVRDGTAYVSDSQAPRVYRLDSVSGDLEVLSEDPRFVSLQGVALARGALYVADYSMGIWRIDLTDGSASLVRASEISLIGIDGLRQTRDGRLVAVRNGARPHQVMAIDLDPTGVEVANIEVLLRGHPAMSGETEPTLVDLADGRAWLVANAAWPLFPADGSEPAETRPSTAIVEIDLR